MNQALNQLMSSRIYSRMRVYDSQGLKKSLLYTRFQVQNVTFTVHDMEIIKFLNLPLRTIDLHHLDMPWGLCISYNHLTLTKDKMYRANGKRKKHQNLKSSWQGMLVAQTLVLAFLKWPGAAFAFYLRKPF